MLKYCTFRFSTLVVLETAKGEVPVESVETNWFDIVTIPVADKSNARVLGDPVQNDIPPFVELDSLPKKSSFPY